MIEQAMRLVAEMAVKSSAPMLVSENEDKKTYLFSSGAVLDVPVLPEVRSHTIESIGDLIAIANSAGDENEFPPVVWYDGTEIVVVFDDVGSRASKATLELAASQKWRRLDELSTSRAALSQKDFIRLLRIDLAGTLADSVLLDLVRRVKFENGTVVTSEAVKNRESLGRQIVSQVSSEKEIPETVTLSLPVYTTPGLADKYDVACSVEVDASQGTFRLAPLPDELSRVLNAAVREIGLVLDAGLTEGIPFYHGAP
jgi:hypothetical protein